MKTNWSHYAFVALGSNLGDSISLIQQARERLAGFAAGPLVHSSLWRSSPVDCPPGSPDFLNAVSAFVPAAELTPETLLSGLQELEREFGRRPKLVLNEARPIDLDLVSFQCETRATDRLRLPHPRAHLRQFVLRPLAEIAPELVLPGHAQTVSELLRPLRTDEHIHRLD